MAEKKLNVFFFPFFASGHMIPMADLAALFSKRENVISTVCLTPANASFLQPTLDPNVKVLIYPFPSEATGLPPGVENLSSVTPEEEGKIGIAVPLSEAAHKDLLHKHRPDAIVSDTAFWSTMGNIAQDIRATLLTWHAVGMFPQVVMNSLHKYVHEITGKLGNVKVKDIPGKEITMPVSELPEFIREENVITRAWKGVKAAELKSHGTIVNTFYGMEPVYCDRYRENDCKRAWFVGPVALARGYHISKGKKEQHECMKWLDNKEEDSVLFVSFGSWCQFKEEQLREIAMGLEDSRKPFLWVVRKDEWNWMPDDGWEERVQGQGMVVRGWAPQVAILEHRAVGAFLTHCGWNSVLEATAAGVPVLTWPLVFEQFINERLMVQVLEVGARVFDGYRSTKNEDKVVVRGSTIAKAVSEFMVEEEREGKKRMKAKELAKMAKAAVMEGGLSWSDLESLIDELKKLCDKGK